MTKTLIVVHIKMLIRFGVKTIEKIFFRKKTLLLCEMIFDINTSPNLLLDVPGQATRILLHSCCAPCSSAVIECMLENSLTPTVFYFNPNIYPLTEYERRKAENIRYVESLHLHFVDGDYDHDRWKENVKGLENEPECGQRCLNCFKIRLISTAQYSANHGFTVFTTTLASSRWKDLEQIAEAGHYAASLYPNVTFWAQNWRKGGLSNRRNELIKLHGFYNQKWCGCEYSNKIKN